ncbi:MAG: thioredoxin family protein [Bradymonadaceae bacterium]|nr:thioredoxin family protein [Lujinxingiaceae bacterium]
MARKRALHRLFWILGGTLLVTAVPALASISEVGGGPIARWPLMAVGLGLALVGLVGGRLLRPWRELEAAWRIARVVGVAVSSIGLLVAMYALTEVPPFAGHEEGLSWWNSYEDAVSASRQSGRPMMVDFTADWCGACKELEAEVFHDASVRERLEQELILVKVDFDRNTPENRVLIHHFEVTGLPRVAFVSSDGQFLRGPSFDGKIGVNDFLDRLNAVQTGDHGQSSTSSRLEQTLAEKGLWSVLLLVFFAGVLSSLTPCVYPLIPITISIFGARQAGSKREGFLLSLTYVFGIAITYAAMGVVAASVGAVFGGAMQNPWLLAAIAALFFGLGLSSLGVFDFRLPGALQTKLSQKGGVGYGGAFVMGLVAGIIAAPCVGPIVAGILLYVAGQQDLFLGWALLMVFALGMGMLFLVLGTFSSLLNRLPRAGGWMEGVKAFFGVVFIAMSLYYLRFALRSLNVVIDGLWLWVAG